MAETAAPAPWAQRQQEEADRWDALFTTAVQRAHPRAAWWWGARTFGRTHGAWCYLCEGEIATYARNYPMTYTARRAVMVHRAEHIRVYPARMP